MGEFRKRPESNRLKMPREQRAKQFAPFESLEGLGGILKQAEEEHRRMVESPEYVNTEKQKNAKK